MAMDSSSRSYQDFEPRSEWLHHPDSHVLILHLLGFRSNQLKVQVTSTGKLRLTGERRLGSGKFLRFSKEFDVPADADSDNISAKLEEGILYVKQPRKPSAVSSTNPPEKPTPKPKPETQPPPSAAKPKADPQPPAKAPKSAAVKPSVDPPTVRQNAPKSQTEKPQSQASGKPIPTPPKTQEPSKLKETVEDSLKLPADPPSVRQNAPQSRTEKTQAQASGKQIPPPQKPQDRTEKQTEEKERVHTKLKEALKKTRDEEEGKQGIGSKIGEGILGIGSKIGEGILGIGSKIGEGKLGIGSKIGEGKEGEGSKMGEEKGKEGIGSKMEKEKGKGKEEEGSHGRELEKESGVAEERRRRRRRKRSEEEEEMVEEESGRWRRRGEGYKQVIDGVLKELKTNMVTLVMGIAVVVIVYLNVTKKAHVEEEL